MTAYRADRPAGSAKLPADRYGTLAVWDPVVRVGHWVLVIAFAVAFIGEGEPLWLHNWAGYAIAATVALRMVWGVVGPGRARFGGFVRRPGEALRYLRDLLTGRARRHLGHSPAGGLMVLVLLLSLAATTVTGMAQLAVEEGQGPLAPLLVESELSALPMNAALVRDGAIEAVHEFFANFTVGLVVIHLLGVLVASIAHRENLVSAMFTGRKRI